MRGTAPRRAILGPLRNARTRLAFMRDPAAFYRDQGVKLGQDVDLIGGTPHTFGDEPYLVTIGSHVTISTGAMFVTHDGGLRVIRHEHPDAFYYAPILVEDYVFIGARAMILPGVWIGERAVVGAGAIVTRDVPPGTVVAGVPAKPVRTTEEYAFARRDEWIDTGDLTDHEKSVLLKRRFASPRPRPF